MLGVLVALMVVPPVVLLVPLFVFGVRIGQISTFRLVILIYVGLMLPFSVYMLTNFFRTIPASMIEAALIDGASSWRVFRRIVLPLSAAPLVTLAVVNLLWVWNELLIALVFLQDDSKKTLMVGITGLPEPLQPQRAGDHGGPDARDAADRRRLHLRPALLRAWVVSRGGEGRMSIAMSPRRSSTRRSCTRAFPGSRSRVIICG